jgi:hypothetical protein
MPVLSFILRAFWGPTDQQMISGTTSPDRRPPDATLRLNQGSGTPHNPLGRDFESYQPHHAVPRNSGFLAPPE